MTKGQYSVQTYLTILVSWKPRRLRNMKLLSELSPKDWTVLGVCLNSVPTKTLLLAGFRVVVVMVVVLAVCTRL